jgi:hypothetical protein
LAIGARHDAIVPFAAWLFDIEKLRPKLRGATTFLELDAILHAWK